MSSKEILQGLNDKLDQKISNIAGLQAAAQAEKNTLADLATEIDAEVKAAEDKGFDEGVAQSGTVGQSDKIFSQEEMDAEIKRTADPLNAQIADLSGRIDALTSQVQSLQQDSANKDQALSDAQAALVEANGKVATADADKASALAALKKDVSDKIKAVEVDNMALADQLAAEAQG